MGVRRIWHGWTSPENADTYERLLEEEIFVGIGDRDIPGYRGIELIRRDAGDEVEFITIMSFDSLDAVRKFAGEDYQRAMVPPAARAVLARFDERSQHYEVRVRQDCDAVFLGHLLKTIQYRMAPVLEDAPDGFGAFSMDSGTRAPTQILSHISDVLSGLVSRLDPTWTAPEATEEWSEQVARYHTVLSAVDRVLVTIQLSRDTALRLTQGPLADVLTHVGQLALVRRLAGAPIPGENFFVATLPPPVV